MNNMFWRHFLSLESDFIGILDYVELNSQNYLVYSNRLTKLLLASGSELDVMFKLVIQKYNITIKHESIEHYRNGLVARFPGIHGLEVRIDKSPIVVKPFDGWSTTHVLSWWQAYNSVKHERDTSYHLGNLSNSLHCMAGLLAMNLYYYHDPSSGHSDITTTKLFDFEGMPGNIITECSIRLPGL